MSDVRKNKDSLLQAAGSLQEEQWKVVSGKWKVESGKKKNKYKSKRLKYDSQLAGSTVESSKWKVGRKRLKAKAKD